LLRSVVIFIIGLIMLILFNATMNDNVENIYDKPDTEIVKHKEE